MLRKLYILTTIVMAAFVFSSAGFAQDEESALSWKKQATDTRGVVTGVIEKLDEADTSDNELVRELITDAKIQLKSGDDVFSDAEKQLKAKDFDKASANYTMSWQYFVKSATAALRANSVLSE